MFYDMDASISVISFSLCQEVMHDISHVEIEEIDVTIKLANSLPLGIVKDAELFVVRTNILLIY